MLRFKNYLSEEVLPAAGVKNGAIDIENTAVRGQINATLANVTAQPAVTPYIVLHRISKALSYFHIIMPKRAYLEGDRGVEVVEVKQFGHRMGMTNDGQFVHDVPSKYFLFISYRLASSMGADYSAAGGALSSVGGMFKVTAKLVDEAELQSLLSMAEVSLAEDCDAEKQQLKAKAMAPKEGMHTALGDCDCSQGDSPSTKSAVDTSMRRKDKKLSADTLDEDLMNEKRGLWDNIHAKRARIKAGSGEKMRKPGSEGAPSSADFKAAQNEEYEMEEAYGVFRKGGSIGEKPSKEPHKTFDSAEEAKSYAGSMNKLLSPGEKKYYRIKYHVKPIKEETLDEVSLEKMAQTAISRNKGAETSAYAKSRSHASLYDYSPKIDNQRKKASDTLGRIERKHGPDAAKKVSDTMAQDKTKIRRGQMDEKLTKAMSAGDVISDFVHSKDPKFKGKSKKMRQKMALGAYYGMHPEKSKLDEASRLKKTTAHRKFATGVNTKTREALGSKSDESKTILVTRKGDPRAAAGGGVRRIPKEKFDPSIYNRASE